MKLLIMIITFALTLGGLFLIENSKFPKEDYAQIAEVLKKANTSAMVLVTPSSAENRFQTQTPTPLSAEVKLLRGTLTPVPIQTPIRTSSFIPSPASLSPSPVSYVTPTSTPAIPSTPQEAGQVFINIASITSLVKQNSLAQLSVLTLPSAQCSINVVLPNGNQSTAKGLEVKTADVSGNVSWSWKINWNTTPGTANIDITCSKDGQSLSKSLQITIVKR
jgi:hypothetical protein